MLTSHSCNKSMLNCKCDTSLHLPFNICFLHTHIYTPQKNLRTTKWKWYNTCYVGLTWGEGQSSPYILFILRSVYSLTNQARHGKGVSVHNHKLLVHSANIRVTNASLISFRYMNPVESPSMIAYKSVEQS